MALLALAGCGSDTKDAAVASAGGTPTAAAVTGDVITEYVEGQRAWVKCLRAQGVEVSDPDPRGTVHFAVDPKSQREILQRTLKCSSLQLPLPRELQDKATPEELQIELQYAKCMRANGVPGFPDPDPDGYVDESDGPPTWDPNSPVAIGAGKICGAMPGQPTSSGSAKG